MRFCNLQTDLLPDPSRGDRVVCFLTSLVKSKAEGERHLWWGFLEKRSEELLRWLVFFLLFFCITEVLTRAGCVCTLLLTLRTFIEYFQ